MTIIKLYIGALILWTSVYLSGTILFDDKTKKNKVKLVLVILSFSAILAYINIIDSEILHGIIKVICVYTLQCLFYLVIFKKSFSSTLTAALVVYLSLAVSEVIMAFISLFLINIFKCPIELFKNHILMNISISIIILLIINIRKNSFMSVVKNSNFSIKSWLIIIVVILVALALLIFRIPLDHWHINLEFIITMLILACFCIIGIILLKQRTDIAKTTSMYQQLVEYTKVTNELLENYRLVCHEQKNQLTIVRSMCDDENKELIDYIDGLINKRKNLKYEWLSELTHIPIPGLKGLINYKLMEMESRKIDINIAISNEIMKTKLAKLSNKQKDNLYSIIGVYLDNAIQAAVTSKKKEVSLEMYKENNDIVVLLANTYKGKINLDKLDEYGYTTKGKNHGVGLHLVKQIIDEEEIFTQSRSLFEDYFVQELRIHLNK